MENNPLLNQRQKIKRTPSGITGLDEALYGGFPTGTIAVVSGGPGCGKTMLSCEFLYKGATQFDEGGLYVSLGETREEFFSNALNFGWDFAELEKKGKFGFIDLGYESLVNCWVAPQPGYNDFEDDNVTESSDFNNSMGEEAAYTNIYQTFINQIVDMIRTIDAKRVVVDPINSLTMIFPNDFHRRREFLRVFNILRESGCTSLILSELPDDGSYTTEEFVARGVIRLDYKKQRDIMSRHLTIHKMRGTPFNEKMLSMRITSNGIELMGETLGFE